MYSCLRQYSCQIGCEGGIVVGAVGQSAIDDADQLDLAAKAKLFVGGTEDVVMEHILDAFLGEADTRDEFVVGAQGRLVLQIHASHDGIDTLAVHLGKRETTLL